jgi:hypothetical protein
VFNFLAFIRRMNFLISQQIFLKFRSFPLWIMHFFLRNTAFKALYIMDVPTDRGAASLSEVFCRIFFLSFFFIVPISKPEHIRISHITLLNSMNCNTLPSA